MPRTCILNALPIDYGVPLPWGRDSWCVPKEMLGLVEGGRLPTVAKLVKEYEEEDAKLLSTLNVNLLL